MLKITKPLTAAMVLAASSCMAQGPRELGRIDWERDFPAAREAAKRSSKPILLLFQEVPG